MMAEARVCNHPPDAFCYVCGEFIKKRANKPSVKMSVKMCEAYEVYFGMPVGNQDKAWAPHVACERCKKTLESWYRGEKRAMRFGVPRIWGEPTDHATDCYFCMTDPSKRRAGRKAPPIVYPNIPSSIAPVPHSLELPVPVPPLRERPADEMSNHEESPEDVKDPDYSTRLEAICERNPYYPTQKDVNDLSEELGLTKANAELLMSRLKQWDLLHKAGQASQWRLRHPRQKQWDSLHKTGQASRRKSRHPRKYRKTTCH